MPKRRIVFVGGILTLLNGCATPLPGMIYTDVISGKVVSSNQTGNRMGEACATSILGLVAKGDASIETARRNGGITMISAVDQSSTSFLGFIYSKYCTIVRGR